MNQSEAGKGDAPRKQQDQKAYEEGWDRIFRCRPKDEDYPEWKKPKEDPVKQHQEDDCND